MTTQDPRCPTGRRGQDTCAPSEGLTITATVVPHDLPGRHRLTITDPVTLEVIHKAPAVEACQMLAERGYGDHRLVVVGDDGCERFSMSIGGAAGRTLEENARRLDAYAWRHRRQRGVTETARACANAVDGVPDAHPTGKFLLPAVAVATAAGAGLGRRRYRVRFGRPGDPAADV